MALRTGSIQTTDERQKEAAEWNRDVVVIRDLDANEVTARARDAYWNHRNEPEIVVDALKPHIERLLEAGTRIAPQNVGQLQLGYWIEGVSAALVKLMNRNEAARWLELFFGLDARYRDRLAEGERNKMVKRLARCQAECARGVRRSASDSAES